MQNQKQVSLAVMQKWIEKNRSNLVKDYCKFLEFPSISSEISYKQDVLNCANWLVDYLRTLNLRVESWNTSGYPVIFAENLEAGPEKPTLLIYNHYDVQPVDPLEKWFSPPFEPTLMNDNIYARGAQDNKGQCFYVLQALKLLQEETSSYPINIKLCIEGEEEIGSGGIRGILSDRKEQLRADYLAIVDTGIRKEKVPAITLGMRGIVTFDLEVQGPNMDLHSGVYGGVVVNPIHALTRLLANLHDAEGRVNIPGFYDDVNEMSSKEKALLSFEFDQDEYRRELGVDATGGERGFGPIERAWLRPTLEVNGISGGYSGTGFKTVIPAKALAKVSCRLVYNQDPAKIGELVINYLKSQSIDGAKLSIHMHPEHGKPLKVSPHSLIAKSFAGAFEKIFLRPCEYIFGGGSIPIASELAAASKSEVIFIGLGLDSDCIHSPNEHFSLDRLESGIMMIAEAMQLLTQNLD